MTMPALSRTARQVFTNAYTRPDVNLNELAHLTGLNPATVARQVRHLERCGLVVSVVRLVATNTPRRARRMCRLVQPAPWTVN